MANSPVVVDNRGRELCKTEMDQILIMAQEQCSCEQIAAVMNVHVKTIYERYSDLINSGRDIGRRRLIAAMWKKALIDEDCKMQIWLSKQHLGYKETWPEVAQNMTYSVYINEIPR